MQAIGLYDPSSLSLQGSVMKINFIDAKDVGNVRPVEISSPEEASRIMSFLREQVADTPAPNRAFHVFGKEHVKLSGMMMQSPVATDEALMMVPSHTAGQMIQSIKMLFEVQEGDLPKEGIAIVKGYIENDTMYAYHVLMQARSLSPDIENLSESGLKN